MESVSIAKKFLELVDPEVKIAGMPDMEICKSGIPRHSITGAIPSDAKERIYTYNVIHANTDVTKREIWKREEKSEEKTGWREFQRGIADGVIFNRWKKNNRRFGLARDGINQRKILCRNTVEKRRFVNLKFEYKSSRMWRRRRWRRFSG